MGDGCGWPVGNCLATRLAIRSVCIACQCMHTQVYVHIWIWTLDNQWFRPFPLVVKLSLSHHRGPGMQYSTYLVVWSTVLNSQ